VRGCLHNCAAAVHDLCSDCARSVRRLRTICAAIAHEAEQGENVLSRQDIDNLGDLLKWWRNRLRVTQQALGMRANCDASTISRIERNTFRPSPDALQRIVDALDRLAMRKLGTGLPEKDKARFQEFQRERNTVEGDLVPVASSKIVITLLDRIITAVSALVCSIVAVFLRRWLLEKIPEREPPLLGEVSWGMAIGLGFAVGMLVLYILSDFRTQARRNHVGGGAPLVPHLKGFKPSTTDLALPIAGGICGSLCWALLQRFVDGAQASPLSETVLWSFTYAFGFMLPFFLMRLWQACAADRKELWPGLERATCPVTTTVVATTLLALGAYAAVCIMFPDPVQEQIDMAVSLGVQVGWALGLALLSPVPL